MSGRLPSFPVDTFPHSLRHFCEGVAEATQTPVEMAAVAMLGALSAVSLGASVNMGSRSEELSFYAMVVMDAGERKSSVIKHVAAPLREIEKRIREEEAPQLREDRSRRELQESRRRELLRKYSKEDDAEKRAELWEEISDTDKQLAMFGHLSPFRLLADDVTAEGLTWLLTQHGRIAILAAEGSAIDNIVGGHYSSGDGAKAAKLDILLKAYSGEAHTVDRRGRDSEHAERPLLAITLAIQPEYLSGLIDHTRSRGLGLVSRFVYVTPPPYSGKRKKEEDTTPLDAAWVEAWFNTLTHIHEYILKRQRGHSGQNPGFVGSVSGVLNKGGRDSLSLSLDSSSRKRLGELHDALEPQLGSAGDLVHIKDWANRHLGRVVRIAGLLHLAARKTADEPIDIDTFARAEEIGDFFMAHGRGALEEPDTTTLRTRRVLEQWEKETITVRELHKHVFYGRGKVEGPTRLAAQLAEEGLLEFVPPEKNKAGGRPSIQYKINRSYL